MKTEGTIFDIEYNKQKSSYNMASQHEHQHHEIYYLISGERFYFIEDQIYHVHQGDLVFISRGFIHRTSEVTTSTGSHERIVVYFTEEFINKLLPAEKISTLTACFNHETKVVHLNTFQQNFVESLLAKMITEVSDDKSEADLYKKILLIELLLFSNRLNFESKKNFLYDLNPVFHTIHKIVRHIRNNHQEHLTLSSLSEQFFISPYYLSRMFKQVTGLTLVEYINNIRIKAAQQLLIQTELPISKIAEKIGYESQTHFGRMFKKITGTTAMKYRKQNSHI